jgi:sarcosine oxidase
VRRVTNRCDVVVVGLGAVGSATSYQLAKAGASVVGIDRFSPPHAYGSSHGETRITRLAVGEGAEYLPLVRRSHELWREIEESTGRRLLVACGGLIMGSPSATGQHGVEDFTSATIALAVAGGIDHEVLEAREVRRRFGVFEVTDEVAYFEPTAGYLRAEECVSAQLQLAERLGASIRRHETVRSVEEHASGVRVETDVGCYEASSAVLAGGPWMPELVPRLAAHLTVHRQVQYWFAIDGDDGRFASLPVFIWLHGKREGEYVYGFPGIDGPRGGVKLATESFGAETTPKSVDRELRLGEAAEMYEAHVRGRFTGLSSRCVRHSVCLYTVVPDFGFLVDVLGGHGNVVVASPCSGHGFKHSAAIGECAAALAMRRTPPFDLSAFRLARLAPHGSASAGD